MRNKDIGVATATKRYEYLGTEPGKVKIAEYPLSQELSNIPARLASITASREKSSHPVQLGPVSSLQPVIVTRNDAPTTLSAIKKRLDVVPVKGVGEGFLVGFDYLMEKTPNCKPLVVDKALIDDWIATLDPQKAKACAEILDGNVHWQGSQDREVFAKPEILLKPEGSAARLIHNGNPTVALVMGAITNNLQKRAAAILSEKNPGFNGPDTLKMYFPTGRTDKEVAELRTRITQGMGQVIEGDFKSNDATQPAEVRKYEALWYRKLGAPDWYVRETLGLKEMNVFSRTLGMKFEIIGQRHSGEEAGTIGNTFNALCVAAGALQRTGVVGGVIIAYGDDTKIWVPHRPSQPPSATVAQALVDVTANHGMEIEVALPSTRHATFLQTRVHVDAAGESFPVPKLGRYLSKLNVRANNNPDISDRDYLSGRYLGLAHQCRYLPSIANVLLDYSDKLSSTPYMERKHKAWKPVTDPAVLRASVLDDRRRMSKAEEITAMDGIYNLPLSAVVAQVHLMGMGACVRTQALNERDPNVRRQLADISKAVGPFKVVDDVDNPAMMSMIHVDTRDLVSIMGDISVI